MNDQLIEKFLRKAPRPKAPKELEEALLAGIRLDRSEIRRAAGSGPPSWLRRWLPGLSFAVLALACLGVVGRQMQQLVDLRRENGSLRVQNQDLAALREANAEVQRLRGENAELNRLRESEADIQRLRNEVGQLRAQSGELAQLRMENKRLKTFKTAAAAGAKPDFFSQARGRAGRIGCVNNLKQICLAARIWADNHNGQFPADFASMSNEMSGFKLLQCPGDNSRQITGWADVAAGDVSYQMFTAGLTENDNPATVVFECPLHHNVALLDGSVQQLSESGMTNHLVQDANGRRIFGSSTPNSQ
jgi:hypothetical protein